MTALLFTPLKVVLKAFLMSSGTLKLTVAMATPELLKYSTTFSDQYFDVSMG
jgi:hypothetical protein